MPRRRSRIGTKSKTRSLVKSAGRPRKARYVILEVPKSVSYMIPTTVVAVSPRPRQLAKRNIRIALKQNQPTVRRRIKVWYSPRTYRGDASSVEVTRNGQLRIDSRKRARRLAAKAIHASWRDEGSKGSTRHPSAGQIESTRSDRFGLIGANSSRSAGAIMDAALVQNALTRFKK